MRDILKALLSVPAAADDWLASSASRFGRKALIAWEAICRRVGPHARTALMWTQRSAAWSSHWALNALLFLSRHVPCSAILGLLSVASAIVAWRLWYTEVAGLVALTGLTDAQLADVLKLDGAHALLQTVVALAAVVAWVAGIASLAAFFRRRMALWTIKAAAAGYTLLILFALYTVWSIPAALHHMDSELYGSDVRNEMWVRSTWILLPALAHAVVVLFALVLRATAAFYGATQGTRIPLGDRIWKDLRTHGSDPVFRKSLYRSITLHIFFVFLLPFLLAWWGCNERPYGIPKGSGSPVLEIVKIKKIKKKIEKKYVFNMNTAISFYVPKIDDSEVFEEVDKLTQDVYEAQQLGKLGAGGGKSGGWPDGMEDARVRFIRLQYDGGDWDQDMGYGADYNMLLKFREVTGFNIWKETEHKRVAQLKRFPKNRAPPFVYLTGGLKGSMHFSQSEIKVLRHYCIKMGGMLFADNGGGSFDRNFRLLMRRAFPELPLVVIAHDDVMFRQPFVFPNGAPPLWHHSGNDALGVKHRGRWIVFYHQGDINDAWKDGHSGASDGLAMQAYKLGVNVINYSFNQYMLMNFGGKVQH